MALNPGSERITENDMKALTHRLRAHSRLEDRMHQQDLIQAADVIERLFKNQRIETSEAFHKSWAILLEKLRELVEMMDDPYKAPEQSIEFIPGLLNALWAFQIEWVVLNRA